MRTLDLLNRYGITVKPGHGKWAYWCCCPIHQEKTPSFGIDHHGRWHCFGCGRSGDDVDLLVALSGCNVGEAMRELREGRSPPATNSKHIKTAMAIEMLKKWRKKREIELTDSLHIAGGCAASFSKDDCDNPVFNAACELLARTREQLAEYDAMNDLDVARQMIAERQS